MPARLATLLTAAAVLWLLAVLTAPFATRVGAATPAVVAAAVYGAAGRICHQRPERSFAIDGVQMPVCARCAGLYLSGAVGVLLAWLPRRRRTSSRDRAVLVACALPTALTWGLEAAGVMAFSNVTRAVAALPLGIAAGWIFVRALRDEPLAPRSGRASDAFGGAAGAKPPGSGNAAPRGLS